MIRINYYYYYYYYYSGKTFIITYAFLNHEDHGKQNNFAICFI